MHQDTHVEVGGQLLGAHALLHHVNGSQVFRRGSNCVYPLSHPAGPHVFRHVLLVKWSEVGLVYWCWVCYCRNSLHGTFALLILFLLRMIRLTCPVRYIQLSAFFQVILWPHKIILFCCFKILRRLSYIISSPFLSFFCSPDHFCSVYLA